VATHAEDAADLVADPASRAQTVLNSESITVVACHVLGRVEVVLCRADERFARQEPPAVLGHAGLGFAAGRRDDIARPWLPGEEAVNVSETLAQRPCSGGWVG
jgi:hypothetical protein